MVLIFQIVAKNLNKTLDSIQNSFAVSDPKSPLARKALLTHMHISESMINALGYCSVCYACYSHYDPYPCGFKNESRNFR